MGSASNDTEDDTLNFWLNGDSTVTAPASLWLALFTTAPGEDGTGGVEATGNGYARASITPAGADSSRFTVSSGTATNSVRVIFANPTASWGTVVSAAIYDAVSGGTLRFLVTLVNGSFTVALNQPVIFPVGELEVTAS